MLPCFTTTHIAPIPIHLVTAVTFAAWLNQQSAFIQTWLQASQFRAEPNQMRLLPDETGHVSGVIYCVTDVENSWEVGQLPFFLPEGVYQLTVHHHDTNIAYATSWALGAYQFTRYKNATRQPAQLHVSAEVLSAVAPIVESIYYVRDWINTPTEEMGPSEFAAVAQQLAKEFHAKFHQLIGEELLAQNYHCIYTVGRASHDAPRLLDLRWGDAAHPQVTLVGKGVCFDSGGLDLKPSSAMLLMKKDMAGGAHALGLARMIMSAQLPIRLRVLIPVVENVIGGNAYRPGDVIKSRQGMTVEVGNTDAEGRLILADALAEAVSEQPALLIDFSTLTGAARVALGTELPAVFSNNDSLVAAVIKHGEQQADLMWRLPLYAPYRDYLNSQIADINNNSSEPYGGAITAALFLKAFVPDQIPWLHFDMMAWNLRARPGRPVGGEAMTLRAVMSYLCDVYTRL
ncbi:MAG TPA: leucyl aminopeptidase family protein [Gammaproteobacteria bacterium]|jgi:leucyl aminopeptidase|nr:leucyl aminopeptidase family protein [Gammaproteobacteria bacterium]